ncbi:MAG: hypothetical protein AAGA47_05115 [Pseudomonadota bacterium]
MKSKVIRIDKVGYDARRGAYGACVTLAAPSGPIETALFVVGHREWEPSQIISALKQFAQNG